MIEIMNVQYEYFRYIVPLLSIADISLTYYTIKRLLKAGWDKERAYLLELNQFAKFFWNKIGLEKGTLFWGLVSLSVIVCICIFMDIEFVMILFGALLVVNIIHLSNLSDIDNKAHRKVECEYNYSNSYDLPHICL